MPASRVRLPALLCAAVALLSGCEATESQPEFSERLKVMHANGETLVPGRSDFVVALDTDALDASIALGVRPIGAATPDADGELPGYLGPRVAGIPSVGTPQDVDLEAVRGRGPQLILGSRELHGRIYSRLRRIASTVTSEDPGGEDWKLDLRLYGEALGRPDAAERLLRDYDARLARLRRRLRAGTEVSLVRTLPGEVRAYAAGSFAGTILEDAGLERPEAQRARRPFLTVPGDRLRSLDADTILLARAPGDEATYRRLVADPRWRELRAVRAGRMHTVRDDAWMVGQGMLAARVVMSDLGRLLGR